MNDYFHLSPQQQQMVLTQAAGKTGLPVQAVEKDLWVTVALQMAFTLPIADKLVFKGGTSLSKVWKVIRRFSEDIDLAIDPSVWGFEGDLTKRQIKRLRKTSSEKKRKAQANNGTSPIEIRHVLIIPNE